MSETKLTRYDWGKEGVVVNPNGDYYDKGDADARIAALERERDELRKRVGQCVEAMLRTAAESHTMGTAFQRGAAAACESAAAMFSAAINIDTPPATCSCGKGGRVWECSVCSTPPAAQGAQP
jgi:hypothetical protein